MAVGLLWSFCIFSIIYCNRACIQLFSSPLWFPRYFVAQGNICPGISIAAKVHTSQVQPYLRMILKHMKSFNIVGHQGNATQNSDIIIHPLECWKILFGMIVFIFKALSDTWYYSIHFSFWQCMLIYNFYLFIYLLCSRYVSGIQLLNLAVWYLSLKLSISLGMTIGPFFKSVSIFLFC